MSDIDEQLTFLFCTKCDRHVGPNYTFDWKIESIGPLSGEDRVAPQMNFIMKPLCLLCKTPLIRKWVEVTAEVFFNDEDKDGKF